MKKLITHNSKLFSSVVFALCALRFAFPCFAQDAKKIESLSRQITESKDVQSLYIPFAELKDLFLQENKYAEFVEFLDSLGQKNNALEPFVNYYTAVSRYYQLKYLEEKQQWDEYFSQGNNYRDQIVSSAQKVIEKTSSQSALHIYARLLLWQFHRNQEDVFNEQALIDLMSASLDYAKAAKDILPLKEVADTLSIYGEKAKSRQLYKIYSDRVLESEIKEEELKNIASNFYKEGNLELSEIFYDAYIDRLIKAKAAKEKMVQVLVGLAKDFSFKDELKSARRGAVSA
jgi:hypothetical protein